MTNFLEFLTTHELQLVLPVPEFILMLWVAHVSRTLGHSTVSNYLAGIRSWHVDQGYFVAFDRMPTLHRALIGVRREKGDPSPVRKLPITTETLARIQAILAPHNHDDRLFFAVATLCVYGLLRLGELLPNSHTEVRVRAGDLKIAPGARFSLHISRSKTDPFGRGYSATYYANRTPSCPFRAVILEYLHRLPAPLPPEGALFVMADGRQPIKRWVILRLKKMVAALGIDDSGFSGHSFRRGGATSLAAAGVPDHIIQTMGRWRSLAYQAYTVPSPEALEEAAARMSRAPGTSGDLRASHSEQTQP